MASDLKLYPESTIMAIADAIRSKGVTGTMKVGEMPDKIASIVAGGSGEEIVHNNGVYEKFGVSVPDNYGLHTVLTNATPERMEVSFSDGNAEVSLSVDFNTEKVEWGYEGNKTVGSKTYSIYADIAKYGVAFYIWNGTTTIKPTVDYKIYSTKAQCINYKPSDGFIRVQGKNLIDENGNVYVIRSIGTQGNDFNSVGNENKPNTWYMRNEVFAEMAQLGFNTTRFVFGYQILESDDNPYQYMESGFEYLDTVIGYARANGIKIILNLHSAQGGTQYTANGINLWLNPENQNRVVALWKEIARRYKNEQTILAYAPMNELHIPLYENGWLPEAAVTYSNFYQRCIDAIREEDKNHTIIVERGLWTYPMYDISTTLFNVSKCYMYYPIVRDNNLAFEWHYYGDRPTRNEDGTATGTVNKDTMSESIELTNDLFRRLHGDIPLFLGEYGNMWSYDSNDALFLEWTRLVDEIAEERQYGRNLHTYYGWHRGNGTINSMGLRYATTWHGTWENTVLYESLANIYRNAVYTQPDPVDVLAVGWRKEVVDASPETQILKNPVGTMMEYIILPSKAVAMKNLIDFQKAQEDGMISKNSSSITYTVNGKNSISCIKDNNSNYIYVKIPLNPGTYKVFGDFNFDENNFSIWSWNGSMSGEGYIDQLTGAGGNGWIYADELRKGVVINVPSTASGILLYMARGNYEKMALFDISQGDIFADLETSRG